MTAIWAIVKGRHLIACRMTAGDHAHPAEHGHADECEGADVYLVDRLPAAHEIPDGKGGWIDCPVRMAEAQARAIIIRRSDPVQVAIWAAKEAEALAMIDGAPAGPIITAEAEATGVKLLDLATQIQRRASEDRADYARAIAATEANRRARKMKGTAQ